MTGSERQVQICKSWVRHPPPRGFYTMFIFLNNPKTYFWGSKNIKFENTKPVRVF